MYICVYIHFSKSGLFWKVGDAIACTAVLVCVSVNIIYYIIIYIYAHQNYMATFIDSNKPQSGMHFALPCAVQGLHCCIVSSMVLSQPCSCFARCAAWLTWFYVTPSDLTSKITYQWIGLRENLEETKNFPMEYRVFLIFFLETNPLNIGHLQYLVLCLHLSSQGCTMEPCEN